MAKRFSDTNKFNKQFYRNLPVNYKLFWDFICLECDHAGIWNVDIDVANLKLGKDAEDVTADKALELFNLDEERVWSVNKGKTWWIIDFVNFQYGKLNPKNKCHSSVIKILHSYNITEYQKAMPLEKSIKDKLQIDIVNDRFYKVDDLYTMYLNNQETVVAFCDNNNITKEQLPNRLKEFVKDLKSKSRHQETWEGFCSYFLNWHRKAPLNINVEPANTAPVSFKQLMDGQN